MFSLMSLEVLDEPLRLTASVWLAQALNTSSADSEEGDYVTSRQ